MEMRIFDVAGATLSVEISGDEALPPLLLLHGGMGSTADFAGVSVASDKTAAAPCP